LPLSRVRGIAIFQSHRETYLRFKIMMLPFRRFNWVLVLAAALACSLGTAARAAGGGQVRVTLVAGDASIQAGHPVLLALHLVHQPHWHTYWSYPGTGLTTSLTWTLPPGWKAGEIQWPAPDLLKDSRANIVGNGYDGDVLLPVELTPPASLPPGGTIELKATADWLMCSDECVPGEAPVSVTLPVGAAAPAADPEWGAKIRAVIGRLPAGDSLWAASATHDASSVTLSVGRSAGNSGAGGAAAPSALHFFSDDGFVAYDQPQTVKSDGRGGFLLTMPIGSDGPKDPARLTGVLTSQTGWNPDGSLKGLRVDAAFVTGSGAAAGAPGSTGNLTARPGAAAGGAAPAAGLLPTLALALIGGLILNLMPCVFPVLGIKILGFVNQAGHDRSKVAGHGLVFASGVLLSFWTLAGVLAVLRAGGSELGWGFQLQSPGFVYALAAVMLVFALNMSGVFEFGLSATGVGSGLQMKSGLAGTFFTGVLATVVATPCSAPFLAPALGAALALPVIDSFVIFTAIAVGLSTPYLLLSIFPGAVRALPRPGAWMETFKQFMAFPLYATVGYLLWVLAGQVQEAELLSAFLGLVLAAMGIWIYGRWRAPGASAGRARFGLVAGLALLAAGGWCGWPRPAAPGDIVWAAWSPEAVAQLRADGRIVYVDFTARWCATCQANKRLVFHSDEVLRAFRDGKIATLRGDWTNRDPRITAELAKYDRSAVPFNLIWKPGHDQPIILPELLAPAIVLKAVRD